MTERKKTGFAPVYDENSRVLVLGSFPSVKSRETAFYYGNKQNRFWGMICGYFGEEIPLSTAGKIEFLKRNGIALWDMVTACEIDGSADASIRSAETAELSEIFTRTRLEKILLNGSLSYRLFLDKYANITIPYEKMSSTSPANPRYTKEEWWRALDEVFAASGKIKRE